MSWFLANMAWASLAMLVVLLVRRPTARLFGAGPAYALWLLPALRLVTPPLPDFAPELPAPALTMILSTDAGSAMPVAGESASGAALLIAIWAIGAILFLGWQAVAYRRFLSRLDASARSLGRHRGLSLIESEAVEGPLALGLIHRRIVVPADFERRYTPVEQRLALEHEAVHHRRGDLWWNHAGLLILALNWFNPLAWLAWRAFRADQELACDAVVTAAAAPGERQDYARALIKSASRPGLLAACPLNHADQLKRRLTMMKTHRMSRPRLLGGGVAVTALIAAGLTLGSPGLAAQQGETKDRSSAERGERSEERIIIRTHRAGDGEHAKHRDHATGDGERREERRVIIHRSDGDGSHAQGNAERHPMHVVHLGEPGTISGADCGDAERSEIDEAEGGQRTRVILCTRGNPSSADQVQRLQRVRDRLAGDDELSGEHRQRVLSALDRQIARLRGQ